MIRSSSALLLAYCWADPGTQGFRSKSWSAMILGRKASNLQIIKEWMRVRCAPFSSTLRHPFKVRSNQRSERDQREKFITKSRHHKSYSIASNLCKTDNFHFCESPMPASGLVSVIDGEVLRILRRRAASVLPPFHISGGDRGSGFSDGERRTPS